MRNADGVGFGSTPLHDRTGRTLHDGDPAHRLATKQIRRIEEARARRHLERTSPAERAILRRAGEPVFGTCPVCFTPDVELVVRSGRETCGLCPWEQGPEALDEKPAEIAALLGVTIEQVEGAARA